MVSTHSGFDGVILRATQASTTSPPMGSLLSRPSRSYRIEPAVPNMTHSLSHSRRSVSTTERNRESTASSESGGRASDEGTLLKADSEERARGARDPNQVTMMRGKFENPQHGAAPSRECKPGRSTRAETNENETSQQNPQAEDGRKPSREPSTPPGFSSRSADREMTARAAEQLSGKPVGGDEAPVVRNWKEKYRTLKDKNEVELGKLYTAKENWKEACGKARKDLEDEKQLSYNTVQRLQSELQHYKIELEELHTSHIRSVNNVGTGLSPISDQEFQKRIRSLYAECGQWCRQAFKGCTLEDVNPRERLDEHLVTILLPRFFQNATPTFAQVIEMVVWGYIENHIFSVLFPGLPSELIEQLSQIHELVINGDHSGTYDRAEFWRAYTTSLMLQNATVKQYLSAADDQPQYLTTLLCALQRNPIDLDRLFYDTLSELLLKARTLSAEMKCQRGLYEVDNNIQVGDPYDEATMEEIGFADLDEAREAVVTAIIMKGIIKRPSPVSKEVVQLVKARVLIDAK